MLILFSFTFTTFDTSVSVYNVFARSKTTAALKYCEAQEKFKISALSQMSLCESLPAVTAIGKVANPVIPVQPNIATFFIASDISASRKALGRFLLETEILLYNPTLRH